MHTIDMLREKINQLMEIEPELRDDVIANALKYALEIVSELEDRIRQLENIWALRDQMP